MVAYTSGPFSSKIMNGYPIFHVQVIDQEVIKYTNKTYYQLKFILTDQK